MNVETCRYEFDPIASNGQRIVTICRHCGEVKVTAVSLGPSQMDMWTQPPQRWLDDLPLSPFRRHRLID